MTPAEFRLLYPVIGLASTDEEIQLMLDQSSVELDECRWGDLYQRGLGLLTAHSLTMSAAALASGVSGLMSDSVTSKKVGDVAVTRSDALAQAFANDPLMRTIYGQEFRRLRRLVGIGAWAV